MPAAVAIFAVVLVVVIYINSADHQPLPELTGVLTADNPDWDWYHRYVDLSEPRIQMSVNMAGGRAVTLSGTVDNVGEKRLDVVQIRVVFFNYEEPVWETVRTPIRPELPMARPVEPMSARRFSFLVHEIPDDWLASHAEMEIVGFRFAAEQP